MSRPDLYQYDPEPFIVRRSLALMLRVVRVGHCVGEAEAELCTRLSTQQVPGPGCTAHWTQCIDHTNTQPPPRERESCLLCPVAPLFSLRWQKCGDGGGTWSGPGHPHLTHPSPSPSLTTCFTLDHTSLMTSPGLSIRQTDISGGPICIVSGAPCVMSHDQAGPEAFLVTKYTTER